MMDVDSENPSATENQKQQQQTQAPERRVRSKHELEHFDTLYLRVADIYYNSLNPRKPYDQLSTEDQQKMLDLKDNINENGQIQPIIVRTKGLNEKDNVTYITYEVVDGDRRLYAIKELLGWKSIKAELKELTDEQVLVTIISTNIHRKDLSDDEKAEKIIELYKKDPIKWKYANIARAVSVTPSTISKIIKTKFELPEEIKTMIASEGPDRRIPEGRISREEAGELRQIHDVERQKEAAEVLAERKLINFTARREFIKEVRRSDATVEVKEIAERVQKVTAVSASRQYRPSVLVSMEEAERIVEGTQYFLIRPTLPIGFKDHVEIDIKTTVETKEILFTTQRALGTFTDLDRKAGGLRNARCFQGELDQRVRGVGRRSESVHG